MGRGRRRVTDVTPGVWVSRGPQGSGYPEQRVLGPERRTDGREGRRVVLSLPGGGTETVTEATLRRNFNPTRAGGEIVTRDLYNTTRSPRWVIAPDGRRGIIIGSGRAGTTVQFVDARGRFQRSSFARTDLRNTATPRRVVRNTARAVEEGRRLYDATTRR